MTWQAHFKHCSDFLNVEYDIEHFYQANSCVDSLSVPSNYFHCTTPFLINFYGYNMQQSIVFPILLFQ